MLSPLTAGWTLLIDSRHQRPVGTLIAGRLRRSEAGGRAVPARPRLLFRRAPRPLSYPSLLSVFSSFLPCFHLVLLLSLSFSLFHLGWRWWSENVMDDMKLGTRDGISGIEFSISQFFFPSLFLWVWGMLWAAWDGFCSMSGSPGSRSKCALELSPEGSLSSKSWRILAECIENLKRSSGCRMKASSQMIQARWSTPNDPR